MMFEITILQRRRDSYEKVYKDPEAEILLINASITTLKDSGELDNYDNGDGDDIGDLTGNN